MSNKKKRPLRMKYSVLAGSSLLLTSTGLYAVLVGTGNGPTDEQLPLFAAGALILATVGAAQSWYSFRKVDRAARDLENYITRARVGELSDPAPSHTEIRGLTRAVNLLLEGNAEERAHLEKVASQAQAASQMKGEFLANMSHEIRTPMNGVLGMVKLILRQPLDYKVRRYADTIEASSHALMTIINDILDFSKMEAGKYTLQHSAFDPRVTIQEVAELLSTRGQEKGVELIYRVAPDVPALLIGDPDRFRQVLNNLVGNAVKFTEDGEVFVEMKPLVTADGKTMTEVGITDTGKGIPKKDIPTLFDAFSQAEQGAMPKMGGTGLGLTISKRLAKMMGGDISVQSTLGQGSKFTVTCAFEEGESDAPRPSLAWTADKKVAVLESSERWRKVIQEHLDTWGLQSEFFSDQEGGLSALREAGRSKRPFDVVLLGLHLDEQQAKEFVTELRNQRELKTIPLIALTQLGQSATLSEVANELQAQIQKPLRLSELFNALQGTFLTAESIPAPAEVKERREHNSHRPVLVVDDNQINQMVAVEELEHQGFNAEVANHGAEAVEMIKNGKYSMILMDCQMPIMDGYTATKEIRKLEEATGERIPIIALTAHAMAGERERVLKAGMDDYLSKPFRPESLRKLMRQHHVQEPGTPPSLSNELSPASRPTD